MIGIALCVHIDAISLLEQPTKKPGKESKPIHFWTSRCFIERGTRNACSATIL